MRSKRPKGSYENRLNRKNTKIYYDQNDRKQGRQNIESKKLKKECTKSIIFTVDQSEENVWKK